jgi:hypothetical protein
MAWWEWTLLGLLLLAFEVMTPGGFYVCFFGAAGLVVGLLVALGVGGPLWLQWLLFSVMAIVSLALFRGPLLRAMRPVERHAIDALEGEMATLLDDLPPGAVGKVELRGTAWTARNGGAAVLSRGQRARVERVDGLTLWIRGE